MTVWMNHPTLDDALIEVPELAVTGHQQCGWRITDPPPSPAPIASSPGSDTAVEPGVDREPAVAAVDPRLDQSPTAPDGEE